jgi:large repetitive protein
MEGVYMRNNSALKYLLVISILIIAGCPNSMIGLGDKVDIDAPAISIGKYGDGTTVINGDYVKGEITLTGNTSDDIGIGSVKISFDAGITFFNASVASNELTWSYTVDTSAYADGEKDIIVLVSDTSETPKTSEVRLLLYFDNTAPLVLVNSPAGYASTDYADLIINLQGEATDPYRIRSVEVALTGGSGTLAPVEGTNSWNSTFTSSGTGNYSFRITAEDYAGNRSTHFYHYDDVLAANDSVYITVEDVYKVENGTDIANLTGSEMALIDLIDLPVSISLDLDNPVVNISNPDPDAAVADNVLPGNAKFIGSISDDDGINVSSVMISIDSNAWVPIEIVNGSGLFVTWEDNMVFTESLDHTLQIKVEDIYGVEEISDPVNFRIDVDAAILGISSPGISEYINSSDFLINGNASSAGGDIDFIDISLDNGSSWNPITPGTALPVTPVTWTYNALGVSDGIVVIKGRASDDDGSTWSYTNLQVTVDTQDPISGFTSPGFGTYVNGSVDIRGTSSDNNLLDTVEIKIGDNEGWQLIPDADKYNWTHTIDSLLYENAVDGLETLPGSGIFRLNVYTRATDVAGNIYETVSGDHYFYIDNALDSPEVSIIYPVEDDSLGGSLIVTGTSSDDDGVVSAVYMQIDVDTAPGGTPDYANTSVNIGLPGIDFDGPGGNPAVSVIDETQTYLLSGNNLWSVEINTYAELYDTDGAGLHTGDIHMRVHAEDLNGLDGDFEELHFVFDDSIPLISNLSPVTDSYVNGIFNITGDVHDETQIKHLEISYDGGTTYHYIIQNGAKQSDPAYNGSSAGMPTDYSIDVEVDTSAIPDVGSVTSSDMTIRFKVTDDTNYQSQASLTYYVDNNLPSGWMSQDTTDIFGSGNDAIFSGYADDTGVVSGVHMIVAYFEKDGNFYNPRDGSSILSSNQLINAVSVPFPISDPGDLSEDPMITTDPDFNYLVIIDNKNETLSGGNSDGDGIAEELNIGTFYEWKFQIDTTNVPDGISTLHYVVYDNAGNLFHNTKSVFIKNNKPVISSMKVGYDLDSSGIVQGDEIFTFAGQFKARGFLYFEFLATDITGINSYKVYEGSDTSGTNVLSAVSGQIDISGQPEGVLTYFCQVTDDDGITDELIVSVDIDNVDGVDPVFTLNSLVQASVIDGHLEEAGESLFDGTDADISGTVKFTGTASDDQGMKEIRLTLDGTLYTLANWSGGLFESREPANFVIDTQNIDPNTGHEITWTYTWDSSTVTGVASTNVIAAFVVDDFRSALSVPPGPNQDTGSMTVDVVPYIESVQTTQLVNGGLKEQNIRSVDGKYSVKSGNTISDFITINGYNLSPIVNGVRVSSTTYKSGLDGTSLVGNNLAVDTVAADFTSVTVNNNSNASGYLSVVGGTVGTPIPSINNINNNALSYNIESILSSGHSALSDDRYITFFDVTSTTFSSSYFPNMEMEGDNPIFGFIQGGAANDLQVRRSTNDTSSFGLIRILAADQMAMARDDDGFYHYASVNSFSQGRMVYMYDVFETTPGYGVNGGATSPYWSGYGGQFAAGAGDNAIELDSVSYTPGLQLGRYVNLQMKVKGSSNTPGQYSRVYMSWYDNYTGQILFRNHRVGDNGGGTNLFTGTTTNQTDRTITSGDTSRELVSSQASPYLAMGITDANIVVIVYYNQSTGYLNLIYSTAPVDRANTSTDIIWSAPVQIDLPYTGWYVSMAIETDGSAVTDDAIHLAAYDTVNADLRYIYLDSYLDTTPDSARVDAVNSVGIYTDIKVQGSTPYIAYYNNSENGTRDSIKLAKFNGNPSVAVTDGAALSGLFSGDWDIKTVPVNSVPQGGLSKFMRVNIDFDTNGNPVMGYAADTLEYSIPVIEVTP